MSIYKTLGQCPLRNGKLVYVGIKHTHTHTSDVGSVRSVEVFPMQLVVLENTHQSDADRKMETLRKNKKKR